MKWFKGLFLRSYLANIVVILLSIVLEIGVLTNILSIMNFIPSLLGVGICIIVIVISMWLAIKVILRSVERISYIADNHHLTEEEE